MRLLALLLLLLVMSAEAQEITIPIGQQGNSSLPLPHNGESQRAVLEQFGLPDVEHPPVGSPKMTRWDYRNFSVYFENDTVISSVRHHHPQYPPQVQP